MSLLSRTSSIAWQCWCSLDVMVTSITCMPAAEGRKEFDFFYSNHVIIITWFAHIGVISSRLCKIIFIVFIEKTNFLETLSITFLYRSPRSHWMAWAVSISSPAANASLPLPLCSVAGATTNVCDWRNVLAEHGLKSSVILQSMR